MVKKNSNNLWGDMNVGASPIYKEWIKENNYTERVKLDVHSNSNGVIIYVTGNLVFEKLDNLDIQSEIFKFTDDESHLTVLDELDEMDIYSRIRLFYLDILKNCLQKSLQEQEDYIREKIKLGGLTEYLKKYTYVPVIGYFPFFYTNTWTLGSDNVEKSEAYINSLQDSPSKNDLSKLIQEILFGCLSYGKYAKDKYWVSMELYALALDKKLKQQ